MTDITTINNSLADPSLPLEVIRSDRQSFPHFRDADEQTRCAWLYDEISVLYAMKHQTPVEQFIVFDAAFMDKQIMNHNIYRDLTFVEISNAFRNGAMGLYGESFGLTCESLLSFLDGFFHEQIPTYKRMKEIRIGNDEYRVTEEMKDAVRKCYESMMK